MPALLVVALLLQDPLCRGEAARHIAEAGRLAEAFDLIGAATAYTAAARAGCESAEVTSIYVRGVLAAREADAQFGSAASLLPLKLALVSLEPFAATDPVARGMRAVLRAAMPAAQHERPEMALLIEEMLRLESLQLEAKQLPLPVLSAHEVAGFFWLQLHVYDEAGRAFEVAARRIGQTPYVLLGTARAAAGRRDTPGACEHYRRLVVWWGSRAASAPEITEARDYVKQQCASAPPRPGNV